MNVEDKKTVFKVAVWVIVFYLCLVLSLGVIFLFL